MTRTRLTAVPATPKTDRLARLVDSWRRSLDERVGNGRKDSLSPRTVESYVDAATRFHDWMAAEGRSLDPRSIGRGDVEDWLRHLLTGGRRPGGAAVRQRSLKVFFAWLVAEQEVAESPMALIAAPEVKVGEARVTRVLSDAEHDRLTKARAGARGGDFRGRRDHALVLLFANTPGRLSEIADLRVEDVELDRVTPTGERVGVVKVRGKGGDWRTMHFGPETRAALDRYLREREEHPLTRAPQLWLGHKGALGSSGVDGVLRAAARKAGIDGFHAHMTRHSYVHRMKRAGASDEYLMAEGGWTTPAMLHRVYALAGLGERVDEEASAFAQRGVLR